MCSGPKKQLLLILLMAIFFNAAFPLNLLPIKEQFPTEYHLLYECFEQQEPLMEQEKKARLHQLSGELNLELNLIPKEHRFAALKAELYLFFLERSTAALLPDTDKNAQPEIWFDSFISKALTQHCSFTQWIISALYQDGLRAKKLQQRSGKTQLWQQSLRYWQELLGEKPEREQKQTLLQQYLLFLEHLKLKLILYRQMGPAPLQQEAFFIQKSSTLGQVPATAGAGDSAANAITNTPKSKDQLLDDLLQQTDQ